MTKNIAITGATGYIGQSLIHRLRREKSVAVSIITRDIKRAKQLFEGVTLTYCSQEECLQGAFNFAKFDILLHMGFSRPYVGNSEIAKSLEFTSRLFIKAVEDRIPAIVNLSSRSVYGQDTPPPWTERAQAAPNSVYGQAKYASELLLRMAQEIHPKTIVSSVRLGAVSGGGDGLVDVFVLSKFVKQAITGEPIRIVGGDQEFDILDIRDTSHALLKMLETPAQKWKHVYNLGSAGTYNIQQMAHLCVDIAARYNGGRRSLVTIEKKDIHLQYGMECQLFYQDMQWKPRWQLDNTIQSLIEYYLTRDRKESNH